jgi:hypothetical protein
MSSVTRRRTSVSFYPETQKQLSALESALQRHGCKVDRTDIIRALVHCAPENEIMARGVLRDTFERSPAGKALGDVAEFAPIRMDPDDFAKLERCLVRLKAADIVLSLAVLVRALIADAPPTEALAQLIRRTKEDLPDGRLLRWKQS